MSTEGITKQLSDCIKRATQPTDFPEDLKKRLVPRNRATPRQLIRSTILEGKEGTRHILAFPAHCLLDMKLYEGYRAITPEAKQSLMKRKKLQSVPALPGILDYQLIADQRCLDNDLLYTESGHPQWLLEFTKEEYLDIIHQGGRIEAFSIPLVSIRPNLTAVDQDELEIKAAIETITSRRIRTRLAESIEIPPLPLSAHNIIQLRDDEDADSDELASIIEADPSLASQVISWANSPYYGLPGQIRSIQDAVIRVLGFDLTMNLSLGLSMSKNLKMPGDGIFGYHNYWREAVLKALLMEKLVKKIPKEKRPFAGLCYLSGLVHNFGYLIIAEIFPPYFSQYCRYQEANPHVPAMYIERFLFGITREQIASFLFHSWGLPEEICSAVRHLHNASYEGLHHSYANLLYTVNQLVQPDGELKVGKLPGPLLNRLGLERETIQQAVDSLADFTEELGSLAELLEKAGK
ncbi:HDOD domain-containing protein [Oceanospirillum sediminis]|uniref:HDOD domain-containing protein n=1 Tax=Oceanospirillum sediminis TaxID=2760088 RepID=A0A839IUL3_9GAMM|nr:HDOD domain-containing protein [Oceanospirillum sediminis]MBB1488372.1 HDOD domain-containing protein [Oceanospirillum sediminis]